MNFTVVQFHYYRETNSEVLAEFVLNARPGFAADPKELVVIPIKFRFHLEPRAQRPDFWTPSTIIQQAFLHLNAMFKDLARGDFFMES